MSATPLGALDNPVDLLILLVVAVLIFGKQLPEVARSVGKGIRELRESANFSDLTDAINSVNEARSAVSSSTILRAAIPDELSQSDSRQTFVPPADETVANETPPTAPAQAPASPPEDSEPRAAPPDE
jgi:sec-independent protein translocase protein TatA